MEQSLAPVPGGTGRYTLQLAQALAEVDGLEISGWTAWHRDTTRAQVPGVRGPVRLPLGRRALTAVWERGLGPAPRRVDLVHATTVLAPPRRRPVVVTVHDAVPWTHPETLTPRGVRWHRLMVERAAATADAVIVPSEATARALSRHVRFRRTPVVVPLGSTALRPPADAPERLARLGVPTGGFLVCVGTMEPRKGLDVLIQALARPHAPDLPLVVVGAPGWGTVDPRTTAAAAGLLPGRIVVLGRLDDQDLAAVLSVATVLVVPSRAEGFGLPVIEGMSAGVPVVTSDDPALVEVGGSATVASATGDPDSLADVLHHVCGDAAVRSAMVVAGRERAATFTWPRSARAHLDVYRRLV
jgi:glycosyltransferase involved in cell wall biosynthesis